MAGKAKVSISSPPRNDEMSEVRRRAQQASQFYHDVGLSNGDLPRGRRTSASRRDDLKRHSGSPEKKFDGVSAFHPVQTAWSQPSTPVFPTPGKFEESWMKPPSATVDLQENARKAYKSSQKKEIIEPKVEQKSSKLRSKSSSQAANDTYYPNHQTSAMPSDTVQVSELTTDLDKPYLYEVQESTKEYYHTLPRNMDRASRLPLDSRMNEQSNGVTACDVERQKSHLYQTKIYTDVTKKQEPVSFTISYTLPATKPKDASCDKHEVEQKQNKSPVRIPNERQRSNSDVNGEIRIPTFSKSIETTEKSSKLYVSANLFGSSSSLDELGSSKLDHVDGLPVIDYHRNKQGSHTRSLSPSAKHAAKKSQTSEISPSPSNSAGPSPKPTRRNKDKNRSKSDVPDHKTIIRNLEREKEREQRMILYQSDLSFDQDRKRRHNFAHYDWQSMTFSFKDVLVAVETLKRKNPTPSGASQAAALAAAASFNSLASQGSSMNGSQEDVSMYLGDDEGLENNKFNDVVASCPYFRNEIGGEQDRVISISASSGLSVQVGSEGSTTTKAMSVLTNHTYLAIVEGGSSERLLPPGSPPSGSVSFGIEQVDAGAEYYRTHFFDKDHQNFFGIDDKYGPVVISLRREKVEDNSGSGGGVYQYRVIVRTCELCTLRGSILEDVIPSRHASNKGLPAKDVLEYVCPEIDLACLKQAVAAPKVHEQIMKVDEQNVQKCCKIGIIYCRAGQVTEEDMYNNEHGSAALEEFLQLLGQKVKLNGFDDFRGGLDVKTDSTGTESVFTTYGGYKIMFHVSTLLPFTPNNKQQLLRKRHIGNDILTIVFQEPGSEPFTPKYMRSHFQHVFIVVRAVNPCTNDTCYRVALTRSRHIPRFGPPIPQRSMFPKSSTFREFLLTKIVNGENMAHKCGKFKTLAINTREQYLRDLAMNNSTQYGLEGRKEFTRFSITSKRVKDNKEKQKLKSMPEINSRGALTWQVSVDDYSRTEAVPCIMGMSDCVLSIVEITTKQPIFSIPCQAILGWTVPSPNTEQLRCHRRDLHVYYGRGEKMSVHTNDVDSRDEIVLRLERFTKGSETIYRPLRRNVRGELGFHVNYEGVVTDVEWESCAAADGLRQSSRLVEICKVAVATMTHEEILDLLRTSDRVTVVIIPPYDDGTPRKCSMELYHLYPVLDIRKIPETVPMESPHERSRSEPVQGLVLSGKIPYTRRVSEDIRNMHSPKHKYDAPVEMAQTDSNRDASSNTRVHANGDTRTTLLATASKLAMVGTTSGYRPKDRKIDSQVHSSASNTLSSTKSGSSNYSGRSGADVDWPESNLDEALVRSTHSLSSDSGLNSNNNSSYSSTLSRGSTNTPTSCRTPSNRSTLQDDSRGSKYEVLHYNQNNNSAVLMAHDPTSRNKRPRNESSIKGVNWNANKLPQDLEQSCTVDCTLKSEINKSLRGFPPGNDTHKKSSLTQSPIAMTSPAQNKKSESVLHTPIKWRVPPGLVTRSETKKGNSPKPTLQITVSSPSASRRVADVFASGTKKKGGFLGRLSPGNPQSVPTTPSTNDVQNSLIRLLTSESPNKHHSKKQTSPTRRSPVRSCSYRTSPKFKTSPPKPPPKSQPILHRALSDESLCGARADDVRLARQGSAELMNPSYDFYGHNHAGSVDSLVPSPLNHKYGNSYGNSPVRETSPIRAASSMLPLPDTSDSWDRILDAAKAAEAFCSDMTEGDDQVFEAASMKSVSMGTLTELGDMTPDLPGSLTHGKPRGKRTMSVEHLYDHEYRGNQGDPSNLLRKRQPITPSHDPLAQRTLTSQSLSLTSPSESELRLEKIEREMRLLQEKLKREQNSKKVLEDQVTSLRRDNRRLLRHVQTKPEPVNGYKRNKRKPNT
ncbi:uncharacterized protein LOC143462939 isoform X2 [Clavelina lepadiformis]|uniref:uncharacterized protein LOC143462939 isoform X2 n=1 Tax=Clavelina lepadiformis TaxID=159417 RepID=UPI004043744A